MSRTSSLPNAPRSRTGRLRLGVSLIALGITGAFVAFPFGTARADEDAKPQVLTITKQAYWSRSVGHAAPNALTTHFPPTVVCLVAPDLCINPLSPVLSKIDEQVAGHQPESVIPGGGSADLLAQAMVGMEEHLPAGVLAGARRYLSAFQFDLPALPEGQKVSKFEVVLAPVEDFTFHFDSPAFRQAVLAALRLIQTEDPEAFQFELAKVGDEAHPFTNTETPLGVEACPILGDVTWAAGSNQDAATAPERDSAERVREGDSIKVLPKQVDCNLGGNGKIVDGNWVFDLTLAANAWADGRLPNNGVLLRPVLPPNLAYGDPDLSTFDQVTFFSPLSTEDVTKLPGFVFATKDKAKPAISSARTGAPQVLGAQTENFTETFGSIDKATAPLDAPEPEPAPEEPEVQAALPALSGKAVTAWWTWLLLPILLGGIYLTTQALTTEVAPVTAERSGAMTRLIEARRRGELS